MEAGGWVRMVQCDISLFLEQLLQIELYFHLQYKFMGCFFSYRWEVEMGYIGSGGWAGIKGITEANN